MSSHFYRRYVFAVERMIGTASGLPTFLQLWIPQQQHQEPKKRHLTSLWKYSLLQ
uniref:Uncharacterized protein n=1 Tax=Arundo donax TaxID=35708 RepID=A0A0A9HMF7_ARUDO